MGAFADAPVTANTLDGQLIYVHGLNHQAAFLPPADVLKLRPPAGQVYAGGPLGGLGKKKPNSSFPNSDSLLEVVAQRFYLSPGYTPAHTSHPLPTPANVPSETILSSVSSPFPHLGFRAESSGQL